MMLQINPDLNTIYCKMIIDEMLFITCRHEGKLIPSVLVTYDDDAMRDAVIALVHEMATSQKWSHELIITDSDVSIFFHCFELSPGIMDTTTNGLFTQLPDNTEVVFDCSADFDLETINIFRMNYAATDTLLFQIVDNFDNIDRGKITTTTLAELVLPIAKVH